MNGLVETSKVVSCRVIPHFQRPVMTNGFEGSLVLRAIGMAVAKLKSDGLPSVRLGQAEGHNTSANVRDTLRLIFL